MRLATTGSAPTLAIADDRELDELRGKDVIELDEPVVAGTLLGGRYVVGEILAEGGMGVVCLGRHIELGHLVAIKFLRRDICDRPSIVQRFLNEAKAAASLRSDHAVRVLDVGQLDNGRPYLVMEHLAGEDLDRLVERVGPLDADIAIDYVLEACTALAEAHAKGIVHRDIKPENLFLADAGAGHKTVKVVDFGLAKRIASAFEVGLTGPRESMGSPGYMSPEQITLPQEVDARTDIWSAGVTLYRLLTGSLPFEGDTVTEIYAHVLNSEPRPIYAVRRGLDRELDSIVRRCLEKDVERRYQSVVELSKALISYRDRYCRSRSRTSTAASAVSVDDSPVKIPMRGPGRATVAVVLLAAFGALAFYEADRTGRIDGGRLASKALEPLLAIDSVRRFSTDWIVIPPLGALAEDPLHEAPPSPIMRYPFGVCSVVPAFDSSGRTLSAEVENPSD
jgi:eukaryotic-like serine/threonine-protein kinase